MGIHKNALLTPAGRGILVRRVLDEKLTPMAVATAMGVSSRTVRKWVKRFKSEGLCGLQDRSSRPHRSPTRTPVPLAEQIAVLRRRRLTGEQIGALVGRSKATVFRILGRLGMNRLKSLEPAPPIVRYQRDAPGEMIHLDTKKLGKFRAAGHRFTGVRTAMGRSRGIGWECVHVCIDDASRVAFSKIMADEKQETAASFLEAALAYYKTLGVTVQRVMTDNGSCYKSKVFREACARHGLKHIRTRPYTPKTNGKAERFIQTALREWAYAQAYETSDQRAEELPRWLHRYNWHRPHGSLKAQTPISRIGLTGNNLMRLHT
ncbi:Putative Integrase catalytic region（DNA-binding domain, IS481-type,1-80；Ribonuclease H-like domain,130-306&|uniref:IS481 family transposase n=1 Tax=Magnetospirillum sp. XM-1 TaxID=1663591 RepID=UPI00073DF9FB|nr:IS481 family transposase [Magnetospirillum sp. XM-1]CUW38152.1 Putative Integrase catalytic region\